MSVQSWCLISVYMHKTDVQNHAKFNSQSRKLRVPLANLAVSENLSIIQNSWQSLIKRGPELAEQREFRSERRHIHQLIPLQKVVQCLLQQAQIAALTH